MSMQLNPAICIGRREVGADHPCYVIAEIGSNHNSSYETAEKLVRACAEAGADAVKFQAFTREGLFVERLPDDGGPETAANQKLLTRRWEVLPGFTANSSWWPRLKAVCDELDIDFLCSPFSLEAIDELIAVDMPTIKIASGDITWLELIAKSARTGLPLILSTGASVLSEIKDAISAARGAGCKELALLHCVSNYPPRWEDANLHAITVLAERWGIPVGLSDHSPGSTLPIAAVPLGMSILEKHVTFDRDQEGLDHHFALEIDELASLVQDIRHAEVGLGKAEKTFVADEEIERYWVRRGLWMAAPISAGQTLTREHLAVLRPCHSLGAEQLKNVVGRRVVRDMESGEPVSAEDFQ